MTSLTDAPIVDAGEDDDDTNGAITLQDFCDRYKLSRSTFYELRKRGLGPREMRIGRRVLIPRRAIREWEETMSDNWSAESFYDDQRRRSGLNDKRPPEKRKR
jgi:predicted DNA-binding transcriptional regulator AlpA